MKPKKVFSTAKWLVIFDILALSATLLTRFVFGLTPPNSLKSIYDFGLKEKVASVFFYIFIGSLIMVVVAWTMILCRKRKANIIYTLSIVLGYFPTFYFIWVVNGWEHFFGAVRLIISGALIYHLKVFDIEAKEEIEPEESDTKDEVPEIKDPLGMKENAELINPYDKKDTWN